jgi:hypothetical protein
MTTINLPATINFIGDQAFYNCSALTSIRSHSPTPIDLSSTPNVFQGVNKTSCTLNVPFGSSGFYATANQWQEFLTIDEMPGLTLSSTAERVGASANSTVSITLQSNAQWTANSNQSWLTIDPASGTGNATLVFTAEANPLQSERTATVTVSAPGTESQTIELTQEAGTGPVINENLALSDAYIVNNPSDCYNALQTITLAGNSTTLTFESGSAVTLIAGQSIRFLPGFYAQNGSEVNAWITTNGTFCDGVAASPVQMPETKSSPELLLSHNNKQIVKEKGMKVYPNPNNGEFTIELTGFDSAELQLCNLTGRIIYRVKQIHQNELSLDLSHLEQGIYLLKAIDREKQIVKKMIISK